MSKINVPAPKPTLQLSTVLWLSVGLQCRPPELIPATASHVVTATILDDELATLGTFFHDIAIHQLDVYLSGSWLTSIVDRPLVFADETHDCVEATVTETHTTTSRTVYMHRCRVENIGLQATTESKLTFQ